MRQRHLTLRMREQLSKSIAHWFRNSATLENLHSGKFPSSKTGDYSDVKVVSPYGVIPWNKLSRFNDEEMKALMIELVNITFTTLTEFAKQDGLLRELLSKYACHPEWNQPQSDPEVQTELDLILGRKTLKQAYPELQSIGGTEHESTSEDDEQTRGAQSTGGASRQPTQTN